MFPSQGGILQQVLSLVERLSGEEKDVVIEKLLGLKDYVVIPVEKKDVEETLGVSISDASLEDLKQHIGFAFSNSNWDDEVREWADRGGLTC